MSLKRHLGLITMLAVVMLSVDYCAHAAVATGASFLKVGAGARAAAMGDAFSAVADDVTALYWNPAGLIQLKQNQLTIGHVESYEQVRHEYFGYCHPYKGGAFGFSAMYSWIGGIEGRLSATPDSERTVPVWDTSPALSFAFNVSKGVSLGTTLKGIYQQLDDKTAYGGAADVAMMFRIVKKTKFAIGIYNLGYETPFVTEEIAMPTTVRMALAGTYYNNRLTVACDGMYGVNDQVITGGVGGELWLMKQVAVRAGYKYNSTITKPSLLQGFTTGVGLKLDKFAVDYAFIPSVETLATHRLSISTKF